MKKLLNILVLVPALILALTSCTGSSTTETDVELKSGIDGVITDTQSGSTVSQSKITLSPCGTTCTTDSRGVFNFADLEPNKNYILKFSHPDYKEDSLVVYLKNGEIRHETIKLVKLMPILNITTNNLDFGSTTDLMTFSISNTGKAALDWTTSETSSWITDITPASGKCLPNSTVQITVKIDRTNLVPGNNNTMLQLNSNAGNRMIYVSAIQDGNNGK